MAEVQVRLLTRGLPGMVGGWLSTPANVVVHFWLVCPLQVHMPTTVLLSVCLPVTSRQSADCTPVIVPLALIFHRWFAPPLHPAICTLAGAVVSWPATSKHIVSKTRNSSAVVRFQV